MALLALLLREAAANRHTSPEGQLDDIVCYPGELSLATLAAGTYFGPGEWAVAELLEMGAAGWTIVRTAGDLVEEGEPLLAEVLLHAYDKKGKRTRAKWAEPFMERWSQVREAIRNYEAQGLGTTFGDTDRVAEAAYRAATGSTPEEIDDRWPPEDDLRDPSLYPDGLLVRGS